MDLFEADPPSRNFVISFQQISILNGILLFVHKKVDSWNSLTITGNL